MDEARTRKTRVRSKGAPSSGHDDPSLLDIANLLDAPSSEIPSPTAVATLDALLRRAPRARELVERLHERQEGEPSLFELARLMVAVGCAAELPETRVTAEWLLRQDKSAREGFERLGRMAGDAYEYCRGSYLASEVLLLHRQVDRLLETEAWRDPAEVLDPLRDMGLDYEGLFRIVVERLHRACKGSPRRRELEKAHARLEACLRLSRVLEGLPEKRAKLEAWVEELLPDPSAAADRLEKLAALLRESRREVPA